MLSDKFCDYVKIDDKTLGFQVLPLAFPYRGRAVPFSFITYSSETIEDECSSRNLQHYRIISELVESLAGKPLVLDRELELKRSCSRIWYKRGSALSSG